MYLDTCAIEDVTLCGNSFEVHPFPGKDLQMQILSQAFAIVIYLFKIIGYRILFIYHNLSLQFAKI